MRLQGEYTIDAPIQTVWEHIFAEGAFARLIPGCKKMEVLAPGEYQGIVAVNMGPIKNDYAIYFKTIEQNPPFFCRFEGKADGIGGGGTGKSLFELNEENGKTRIRYEAKVTLTGPLSKIGPRYVESAAKSMIHMGMQKMEGEIKTADLATGTLPLKSNKLRDFFRLIILFIKGLTQTNVEK